MDKSEFLEFQRRHAASGMALNEFLKAEGVATSSYYFWRKKYMCESETLPPMAPITIKQSSHASAGFSVIGDVAPVGVVIAFPNGVHAHFGRGSEGILLEVISKSMS